MHTLNVQEKYYNMLKSGIKTIELRLFDEKRQAVKIGDIIEFTNASDTDDKFVAEVVNLHRAEDFQALCQKIDCRKAGFKTNEELIKCLAEFYTSQKQKQFGVLGIEIKKMRLKIIFANVIQGMIHIGYNEKKENLFAGFHPEKYVAYFAKEKPDILCMAECLFDTPEGESAFVKDIAEQCGLPYYKNLVGEKAFFVKDKYYGLSICSKFPIEDYEVLKLANPQIETIRPNGEHWVMHDKYIQKVGLCLGSDIKIQLINTHMFPFQHFNKHFWDAEFAVYRKQWAEMLIPNERKSVLVGDFNTVGISIDKAFPELEVGQKLQSLVTYEGKKYQPKYPYDTQIEYILATKDFKLLRSKEEMLYSDHPFLVAEISL